MSEAKNICIPREVLLVEIERYCTADAQCKGRTRIGLTKEEARSYIGFECEKCKRFCDDALAESDVPDWWEELTITGLDQIRPHDTHDESDSSEVILRLSEAMKDKDEN